MQPRRISRDACIFGVDVQSGDIRGESPQYALVQLRDGELKRDVVSHRKLRRLVDEIEPAVLATDNVYELARDKDALVHFLEMLPAGTRLVQVTGAERPEPLSRVASRHGVPYESEPMAEAEAAAKLAAVNVGMVVTAHTGTTIIKVARGRSTGSGGWSEDRYTRRIHGAVKRRSKVVAEALDEAGLEYERSVTEKYGGYSNAVFTVEAPPDELPLTSERSGDVRVEIERERGDGISFEPLAKRRDHVIVGIDPGTTTAAAVVSIDGEVLDVHSSRTEDTADVIEWIIARGRPFLVAADVTPMPETVDQIRRSFDAAGWTPETDLLVDRKQDRTRSVAHENDHERDAIAAALFAVDDHREQFDRITERVPARFDRGDVIARVVAEESSVEAIIAEDEDDATPETDGPTEPQQTLSPEEERIRTLEGRIDELEGLLTTLQETISDKDDRIEELEAELEAARREERRDVRERREVTRRDREIERLTNERDEWRSIANSREEKLERLKELWRLDHSNFSDVDPEERKLVPVKPIEKFTREAIEAADSDYGLAPDDVILLRDATGAGRETAERLARREPRAIVKRGGLTDAAAEVLFESGIPFGERDDVRIQEVDELAVAREDDVEALIEEWHERAAERRRTQKAKLVDRVISEHRAERLPEED